MTSMSSRKAATAKAAATKTAKTAKTAKAAKTAGAKTVVAKTVVGKTVAKAVIKPTADGTASAEATALAARIERDLRDGRSDTLTPQAFQALMAALCKAANLAVFELGMWQSWTGR